MTDKQIIINGVDVSECSYYQHNMCTATKDDYGDCSLCCQDYDMNDCYYKQLKRKEQECEKYSKALEYFLDETGIECLDEEQAIRTFTSCGISFRKMQQVNNKYKQALEEIKDIAEGMNEECFYDDFDCMNCDMQNGCTYFNKKQILQKISEYEVEKQQGE